MTLWGEQEEKGTGRCRCRGDDGAQHVRWSHYVRSGSVYLGAYLGGTNKMVEWLNIRKVRAFQEPQPPVGAAVGVVHDD